MNSRGSDRATTRVVWFVFTIAIPGFLGIKERQWISSHPITAVAITAAYYLIAAFSKFFAVISERLTSKLADSIATKLYVQLMQKFSRFEKKYYAYLRSRHRLLEEQGQQVIGGVTLDLAEVFIDVSLLRRPSGQISTDPFPTIPAQLAERSNIWEHLPAKGSRKVLAVVAGPGCGKSTLLTHMTLELCEAGRIDQGASIRKRIHRNRQRRIPILLLLRDHAKEISSNPGKSLADLVSSHIEDVMEGEPKDWFRHKLLRGRCIIMLDGLDEVAVAEDRRKLVDWVGTQVHKYAGNDFIITSRPGGYNSYPLKDASVLQIRDFSQEQVERFIYSWCKAVRMRQAAPPNSAVENMHTARGRRALEDAVQMKADEAARTLIEKLDSRPELSELTVNPLLLAMIASVHHFKNALPGSRAELYADICESLLYIRQNSKGLIDKLNGEQKIIVVSDLALRLMIANTRDCTSDEVGKVIAKSLSEINNDLDATDFLKLIVASGLMVERESGVYSFAHHTFQEYLAAACIRRNGEVERLVRGIGETWWRETTLLYVARADATAIIEECLKRDTPSALALALDCFAEASIINPVVRSTVQALLIGAPELPVSDPRRKQLLSAIVSLWARDSVSLASGSRLCISPAPVSLFRIYANDASIPRPPADVLESLSSSDDDAPVIGVRATDARYFVEWLNKLSDYDHLYRLPTRVEASDKASIKRVWFRKYSYWLESESGKDVIDLSIPPGAINPLLVDLDSVHKAIHRDLESLDARILVNLLLRAAVYDMRLVHRRGSPEVTMALSGVNSTEGIQNVFQALTVMRRDALDPMRGRRRVLDQVEEMEPELADVAIIDRVLSSGVQLARDAFAIAAAQRPTDRASAIARARGDLMIFIEHRLVDDIPRGHIPEQVCRAIEKHQQLLEFITVINRERKITADLAFRTRIAAIQYALGARWSSNENGARQLTQRVLAATTVAELRLNGMLTPSEVIVVVRQ